MNEFPWQQLDGGSHEGATRPERSTGVAGNPDSEYALAEGGTAYGSVGQPEIYPDRYREVQDQDTPDLRTGRRTATERVLDQKTRGPQQGEQNRNIDQIGEYTAQEKIAVHSVPFSSFSRSHTSRASMRPIRQ